VVFIQDIFEVEKHINRNKRGLCIIDYQIVDIEGNKEIQA